MLNLVPLERSIPSCYYVLLMFSFSDVTDVRFQSYSSRNIENNMFGWDGSFVLKIKG
jgi:hypothetical protein